MIIILGLIILIAALVAGVAGVLGNGGSAHAVSHFSALGYHLTGSAGTLFLAGIIVGAAGLVGLSVLLAGAHRRHRRGSAATRRLRQSRRETAAASQERDDLIDQRDTARAYTDSNLGNRTEPPEAPLRSSGDRRGRLRGLRHRLAPGQTGQSDALAGRPASDVAANASNSGVPAIAPVSDVPAGAPGPDAAVASPAVDAHASVSAE
jgi:hypothetical protein